MKTLQKFGGIAALYMALAHLIGINYLHRHSGLPQHHRSSPKGRHERRQPDGRFFNQPAHVRVLWLFSDCPVAGVV